MKKLIAMLLAMMMILSCALAESNEKENMDSSEQQEMLNEVIGEADGPTSVFVTTAVTEKESRAAAALAANRRINTTLRLTGLENLPMEGIDAQTAQAAIDLLEALGLRFSMQGDEIGGALMLSGQEVLTLGGAVIGDDLYLSSNLLGGAIVIAADEMEPLFNRLIDLMVSMGSMTEQDAADIKSFVAQMKVLAEQHVEQSAAALTSLEDVNFAALEEMFVFLMGKLSTVENPVVPRMCDQAVSGVQLALTNEDMVQGVKYVYRFLLDNPALTDMMGISEEIINEAMAQADSEMFGDFSIAVYGDEAGLPVYMVLNMASYEEGEPLAQEIVYTRQTVAAGVAHTVTYQRNDHRITFEGLAAEGKFTGKLLTAEGETAMDVLVDTAAKDEMHALINLYEGEEAPMMTFQLDGQWENSDVREFFSGKLSITGQEPGEQITLEISADCAIDGVDYTSVVKVAFDVMGMGMGFQVNSETAPAQESIMAGNVVRPAELDDTAFQNWFTQVITNAYTALMSALPALPESVLTLVLHSGM